MEQRQSVCSVGRRIAVAWTSAAVLLGGWSRVRGAEPPPPVAPLSIDKPLIAQWNFDEQFGTRCVDVSGRGHDAAPEFGRQPGWERVPGVFGSALHMHGHHKLQIPGKPAFGTLPQLSFSAWTMPTEMGTYREIFRKEDGDHRVLFSYQDNFTVLSLGLNIGGYIECDAKIEPGWVIDGAWHHCAATFDGRWMRVYLDGKEIGALERPGAITAGGAAAGCIGSSNGGENFQGGLDDLRIYAAALTPEDVGRLYQNGAQALARQTETVAADEPQAARPLLAHWTFNERGGGVIRDSSGNASVTLKTVGRITRTRGVHGWALNLAASPSLEAGGFLPSQELAQLAMAAWVRPTDLAGNRTLLRQAGPHPALFAFQANGSMLTLGLDVGGYVECAAKIDPARLLDGQWHHSAATFDGRCLRLYLDGKEVGTLQRAGRIAAAPGTPCFLASADGKKDPLPGALDDFRIYAAALSAEEVASLYRAGTAAQERYARTLAEKVQTVFAPARSFAETMANTRRNLVERQIELDAEATQMLLGRLRTAFPAEFQNFATWTGADPLEYLTDRSGTFAPRQAARLVEMILEYRPLTERQWKQQTPEQLAKWKAAEAVERQLEQVTAQGNAAKHSPAWIDIILAAGPCIEFRPTQSEAVAPYVRPQTPETRDLTAAEAREALERDWLHQAQPATPERVKNEIGWTRELAERLARTGQGRVDFSRELEALARLESQANALKTFDQAIYFRVREIKRSIALRNPRVDFDSVLLVDMPYPAGSEWPHETRHRLGYMAVPGGRLLVLKGLGPDGKLTQLMPQPPLHGAFWRPDLSYDARKVVFSFKPHNEKAFHLYEINIDGSGLVQMTAGIFDDFDPIYLPDDQHVVFPTTRGHTYVRCMPPTNAFVLARCDRDGKNIYFISSNNEPDYLPSVMNDGRLVYTRWEYTDKPLWRAQKLWTMNPDGTQNLTFWGNQSVWPDLMKDARSIPGSRRVMFTGSAHHNWFSGSVGIIDPDKGLNFPDGLTKVTADVVWPECGNGPVDPVESPRYHSSGHYAAYYSPYPLSEQDFLVSAQRGGKFVLYWMDVDGNRELIYEGVHNVFHAQPVRVRPKPPLILDRVVWPSREERLQPQPGVIFSSNVYEGAAAELQGKAKFLRVWHIDQKTYTYWHKRPYISTGPVVSMVQSDGVKRMLGTVPIEADGSVAFLAPPVKSLHFQLLDENHRALQTMRSFTSVMPAERRGCVGCHESHSRTMQPAGHALALARGPQTITPPPWGDDTVGYMRYVQPVLDRYCGKCHQGDGEGRKTFDLTVRPGFLMFQEPYVTLIGRPSWGQPYQPPANPPPGFGIAGMLMVEGYGQIDPNAYVTPKPMTSLSYKSKLIERCSSGQHHGVKVDPVSLLRLIAWVDAMCPYFGEEEIREIPDPDFQGVDWLSIRPRIATAPRIVRPGPVD
jgi:hypothetical protein